MAYLTFLLKLEGFFALLLFLGQLATVTLIYSFVFPCVANLLERTGKGGALVYICSVLSNGSELFRMWRMDYNNQPLGRVLVMLLLDTFVRVVFDELLKWGQDI